MRNINNKEHKYIFLTLNDFKKQDGGPVRMYGILNALAHNGNKVIFYSNTNSYHNFHPKIDHISLDTLVSSNQKRAIQFLLSIFPYKISNWVFNKLLIRLQKKLNIHKDSTIYFFEYLDNTIGYWLYKNKIIKSYVNDIHGIAPLEFQYQKSNAKNINSIIFSLKEKTARNLDNKVLSNAKFNIFASERMYDYFMNQYPNLKNKRKVVIPNLLSEEAFHGEVDLIYLENFKKTYQISDNDFIIMFAGSFKLIGGVSDLIKAYELIENKYPHTKLLLIGDGPEKSNCEKYVYDQNLSNKIIFTGKTPYHLLPTFQSLSKIIVCPEQNNPYSHLIIHLKYLDSLLSNKVVIAGKFDSIQEINVNEKLSVDFVPSDIKNLSNVLEKSILHYPQYIKKYKNNKSFAYNHLTYSGYINKFF